MPRGRIVGTAHAIAVTLTSPNAAHVCVPDMFRALGQRYPRDLGISADAAKQAQRHSGRVLGKYGKVRPRIVGGRA